MASLLGLALLLSPWPCQDLEVELVGVRRGRNSNSMTDIHGALAMYHACAQHVFICTVALKNCILGLTLLVCQIRGQRLCFNYLIPPKIIMHFL